MRKIVLIDNFVPRESNHALFLLVSIAVIPLISHSFENQIRSLLEVVAVHIVKNLFCMTDLL